MIRGFEKLVDIFLFIYRLIFYQKIIWKAGKNGRRLVDKTQDGIFRFVAARKIDSLNIRWIFSVYKFIFPRGNYGKNMRHNATFARDYTRFKRTPFVFKTDLDNFSTITFTRSSLVEIKLFFYFLFLLVSEHSRINSSVKNSRCPTRRRDDNWLIRSANHLATACRHERWIKTWRDREKDGPRDRFAVGTN